MAAMRGGGSACRVARGVPSVRPGPRGANEVLGWGDSPIRGSADRRCGSSMRIIDAAGRCVPAGPSFDGPPLFFSFSSLPPSPSLSLPLPPSCLPRLSCRVADQVAPLDCRAAIAWWRGRVGSMTAAVGGSLCRVVWVRAGESWVLSARPVESRTCVCRCVSMCVDVFSCGQ